MKIGVHGISVGGLAATHLGRIGAVDFMMLDRTFSDLQSFPRQFHSMFSHLLKFITMWENPNNERDYLFSNCYKVIGQDPKDAVVTDITSVKTGIALELLKNELDNKHLQMAMYRNSQRSVSIEEYYHILNKSETEILYNSLEQIFFEMFQFEIESRQVRRRFCAITSNSERVDSSGATARRVLTSREKTTKKYDEEYTNSFASPDDRNVMALTDFMNADSFVENNEHLQTERDGGDDDEAGAAPASPGRNDSSFAMDESMYQDTSLLDESLASSRSLTSPSTSPRKAAGDTENKKYKLMNDSGQIRLTPKMRMKEKELRKFLSLQRNRPLR